VPSSPPRPPVPPRQVDSEGRKFGKSTGGAIWLSSAKLSPYKFYQYLFATADADVPKFLRMLTFLPLEEVGAVEAAMQAEGYAPNTAQRSLAEEVTRWACRPAFGPLAAGLLRHWPLGCWPGHGLAQGVGAPRWPAPAPAWYRG
jgi:hypothetical protein